MIPEQTEAVKMIKGILAAIVLSFGVSLIFGKEYIPWLKNHGFTQPVKDEVADKIYNKQEDKTDE